MVFRRLKDVEFGFGWRKDHLMIVLGMEKETLSVLQVE